MARFNNILSVHFEVDLSYLDELEIRTPETMNQATQKTAEHILRSIKDSISTPVELYGRSKRGNPPHLETGTLHDSGRIEMYRSKGKFASLKGNKGINQASIIFGSREAFYADELENGELFRPFMSRPFNDAYSVELIKYYVKRYGPFKNIKQQPSRLRGYDDNDPIPF